MSENVIRIQELALENFQNVARGEVQFPGNTRDGFFGEQADVLGIYGQNGSGKTALLHALAIIKSALSGNAPGSDALRYIMQGKDRAYIRAVFSMKHGIRRYRLEYSIAVGRRSGIPLKAVADNGLTAGPALDISSRSDSTPPMAVIEEESLKYAEFEAGRWSSRRTLAEWSTDQPEELLRPKKSLVLLAEEHGNIEDIRLAKRFAVRQGSSLLFSDDMKRLTAARNDIFSVIIPALRNFGEYNLYIIGSRGWGPITMNTGLPFHFRLEEQRESGTGRNISMGIMMFRLDSPTVFPLVYCKLVEKAVLSLNEVLSRVIPGMRLRLRRLGRQLMQDGAEAIVLEPVTTRDGRAEQIPLRDESEGIKKLISMLGMFVAAHHSPTMTLAIDELDAGIHEYLLGELLDSFRHGGRGQLVFTSHNLRPLECLDKRSIVFATSDPEGKYIRLKNVKTNNNLRDVYYNLVSHGVQSELYRTSEVNSVACRKVGSFE